MAPIAVVEALDSPRPEASLKTASSTPRINTGDKLNTLHTGVLHLDTTKFDNNTAHLYEHLIIAQFQVLFLQNYKVVTPYGWLNGETYAQRMFIDFGFYDADVEKLFFKYIEGGHAFTPDEINAQLSQLEAESRARMQIADMDKLMSELAEIDKIGFTNLDVIKVPVIDSDTPACDKSLIAEIPAEDDFTDHTVSVGLIDPTDDDSLAFLRILPIVYDLMHYTAHSVGGYGDNTSGPRRNKRGAMGAVAIYTFGTKKFSAPQYKKLLQRQFREYAKADLDGTIVPYLNGFTRTSTWSSMPLDYYKTTGILASRELIAGKITSETISDIISRLDIEITKTTDDHRHICH